MTATLTGLCTNSPTSYAWTGGYDLRGQGGTTVTHVNIINEADTPVCTVVAPRAEEAPAPVEEVAAPAEPELIRKPKPEGEDEAEAAPKA